MRKNFRHENRGKKLSTEIKIREIRKYDEIIKHKTNEFGFHVEQYRFKSNLATPPSLADIINEILQQLNFLQRIFVSYIRLSYISILMRIEHKNWLLWQTQRYVCYIHNFD